MTVALGISRLLGVDEEEEVVACVVVGGRHPTPPGDTGGGSCWLPIESDDPSTDALGDVNQLENDVRRLTADGGDIVEWAAERNHSAEHGTGPGLRLPEIALTEHEQRM